MPQCEGICKGSGNRCRKSARIGELTCNIKDHVRVQNSISDTVLNHTYLPRDLANMIENLVSKYPTTAYLIGGIDPRTFKSEPSSIDSITMDTNPSTDVVKLPHFHHNVDNNKDKWAGSHFTSCVLNELIYVFGGQNDTDSIDISSRKVAIYNPLSDTWDTTTIPMIPEGCIGFYPVVIGSNIYILGGEHEDKMVMYMLDTRTLTWSKIPIIMPLNIQPSSISSIDKVIYAFGRGISDTNMYMVYTFHTEVTNPSWQVFAEIEIDFAPHTTVVIKNKMYLFGYGRDNRFCVFDVRNKNYTYLGRYRGSIPFLLDDERHMYTVSASSTRISIYDIEKDSWLDEDVEIPRNDVYGFSVVTLPGSSRGLGYDFSQWDLL
jgi:hypothetical protein